MSNGELRVLLNQVGATIELHRPDKAPVVLTGFTPDQIRAYGRRMAAQNPDMQYASSGQVAIAMARAIAKHDCIVSPYIWTFDPATGEYSRE